jgi:acetyl esterase/lipase
MLEQKGRVFSRRDVFRGGSALAISAALNRNIFGQTNSDSHVSSGADPLSAVNPEFRGPIAAMSKGGPPALPFSNDTLPQMRAMARMFARPKLANPAVTERTIPGPKNSPPVRILMAGTASGANKPAVLHVHGGGFVSGSPDANARDMQDLVIEHDCAVISVDYRLAPETRFPGPLEDNYAALKWMYANASELGIDRKRIAIKGESAGGGHAAMLSIAARDRGEVPICLQVLIYPMLDDRTGSSMELPPPLGSFIWTSDANRYGWTSLLGVPAGSPKIPTGAVPARVHDLRNLPSTFIGVGSIDLFCPEDLEFAKQLVMAGVSTEVEVVPGGYHGFDILVPDASLSVQFGRAWNSALKRAFASV